MATCGELTDYFSELNDIEQENEVTIAVDDDTSRTPDGLSLADWFSSDTWFILQPIAVTNTKWFKII